jgi:hypothetical protein
MFGSENQRAAMRASPRAVHTLTTAVNRSKDVTPSETGDPRQSTNRPSKVATLLQFLLN